MKYRLLSQAELNELEKEFIDFLVSNTITADEWTLLKEQRPEKAQGLIEIFSDIVLERALKNIKYVEYREAKNLMVFHFDIEQAHLVGVSVGGHSAVNFNEPSTFEEALRQPDFVEANNVEVFTTSKKYQKQREAEIFDLLQSGGLISDEKYFRMVKSLT
jgi:hypothetical protein